MKKVDNFDAKQWLVENKITTQSRLMNENQEAILSPNIQKKFNMIVSALKKAKSEKDIDQVHTDIMLLPKKLTKIFIDKLVNMGLAEKEGDNRYSLSYDDGLDESKKIMSILNEDETTITTQSRLNEIESPSNLNPITKKKFDNLIAMVEKAVAEKDQETLYQIYNKGLNTGSKGWSYFIDSLVDKGLASIDDRGMLKFNLEESRLNEGAKSSIYYKLGYQIGPNGRRATVDTQSVEYKTIEEKANQLASLLNDKDLIDFAKGSTDSIGSSRSRYEGLQDVASSLLFFNKIKDRLGKTID